MAAGDKAYWSDVANAIRPPRVRLVQQALQSIPNVTATALTFGAGSEDIDTHNFHDTATNPSRITPTVAGDYQVTITVSFASNTATQLYAVVGKNGTPVQPLERQTPAATAAAKTVAAQATVSCNGTTDYLEGLGSQNSGGALNTQVGGGINSVLEAIYLGPS